MNDGDYDYNYDYDDDDNDDGSDDDDDDSGGTPAIMRRLLSCPPFLPPQSSWHLCICRKGTSL